MTAATVAVGDLRNIGPTIASRLKDVGICTRDDLARVGAPAAFRMIRKQNPDTTIAVCYYLYSLEGSLRDKHWDDLPAALKRKLRIAAGID